MDDAHLKREKYELMSESSLDIVTYQRIYHKHMWYVSN
jgi:hypothetical protein